MDDNLSDSVFATRIPAFDIIDSCSTGNRNMPVAHAPDDVEQIAEEESQQVAIVVTVGGPDTGTAHLGYTALGLAEAENLFSALLDKLMVGDVTKITVEKK